MTHFMNCHRSPFASFRIISSRLELPIPAPNGVGLRIKGNWAFQRESDSNPKKIHETHVQSASEAMIFFPHAWHHPLPRRLLFPYFLAGAEEPANRKSDFDLS
jgi:hypothetical protein